MKSHKNLKDPLLRLLHHFFNFLFLFKEVKTGNHRSQIIGINEVVELQVNL